MSSPEKKIRQGAYHNADDFKYHRKAIGRYELSQDVPPPRRYKRKNPCAKKGGHQFRVVKETMYTHHSLWGKGYRNLECANCRKHKFEFIK